MSVDSDTADYCSSWEKILASAAAGRAQDIQRQKAAHVDRLRSLSKSNKANDMARRKQQLHIAHEIIEVWPA